MKTFFNKLFVLILIALISFSFIACSKSKSDYVQTERLAEEAAPMMKAVNSSVKSSARADSATYGSNASGDISSSQKDRKLIKNGSICLEVENLTNAEKSITEWCKSFDGYIASSYTEETRSSFSVKIPAKDFDNAMSSIGSFGKVKSRNISTQDVTEQFYDLETRLETRKILKDRLQTYLANAKDMKDLIQIENELNNTISDIESMEGRMRRLSDQIEFSTINVTVELPYRTTEQGFQWPEFGKEFRYFISNIVDFFAGFISTILYIVIFGIPILAAIAFFYWILLGKVGLLKKIFKKLSDNKEE